MQENSSQNAISVLNRLKSLLNIKTDADLAEFLNVKANTISTWKSRNSVDYQLIISVCELYEIDLNFLFLGVDRLSTEPPTSRFAIIDRELHLQYCSESDRENAFKNKEIFRLPTASQSKIRGFEVGSNNMFPVLEENSVVICEEIQFNDITENALIVVVSRKKGIFAGYFSAINKNIFSINFENNLVNDVLFDVDEDCEFWNVKSIISHDLNSSKRINALRDSVLKVRSIV